MNAIRTQDQAEAIRRERILTILAECYPKATIALRYGNPWELLVSVILSAQCTDVMVNKVTQTLFTTYPTLTDYVNADISQFERAIKSTGFYHAKAKNVLANAKRIAHEFDGKVPSSMDVLLTLPGVARKTANVVLGNAFGKVEGIAVDTHVLRISQRLRLVNPDAVGGTKPATFMRAGKAVLDYKKDADPGKVEISLMSWVPKSAWFALTYRIIDHGRAICKAQNPDCGHCPLSRYCPASRV